MKPMPRGATLLSVCSAACAAIASLTTLAWDGAFPAPALQPASQALSEARGWSVATLLVALPVFAVSLSAARRGSLAGRLAWLGTLFYFLYTYLELAVSPPFTPLYLIYIVAFACAIPALSLGASSLDLDEVAAAFGDRAPRRSVSAFGLAVAVVLSLAWLRGVLTRTAAGEFGWPAGDAAVGHVVVALDLGLQVPLGLAAALLLIRRRPAGLLLAAVLLIDGVCMGFALLGMVAWAAAVSGQSFVALLPFVALPLVASGLTIAFFRALAGDHGRRERRPRFEGDERRGEPERKDQARAHQAGGRARRASFG